MNNCHRKALIHSNCSNVYSSLFSAIPEPQKLILETTQAPLSLVPVTVSITKVPFLGRKLKKAALSGRSNPARLTAYPGSLSWLRPRYQSSHLRGWSPDSNGGTLAGVSPREDRATAPLNRDLCAALAAAPLGSPDSASGHAHPHGPPRPRDPIGQRIRAAMPLPPRRPNWRGCLPLPAGPHQGSLSALRHHLLP